jgi:hypothetical protein
VRTLLHLGENQKRRAATAMNDRSTRAHSIFILTLKQRLHTPKSDTDQQADDTEDGITTLTSKLFLADLGGSEQVKKSKVNAGQTKTFPVKDSSSVLDDGKPDGATDMDADTTAEERDAALYSTGFEMAERMREAVYINLGLLALKKCIEALNSKSSYVPYQVSS